MVSQGGEKRWSEGWKDPHRKGHHQPGSWPACMASRLPSLPSLRPSPALWAQTQCQVKLPLLWRQKAWVQFPWLEDGVENFCLKGSYSNEPWSPWVQGPPPQMEIGLWGRACQAPAGRHDNGPAGCPVLPPGVWPWQPAVALLEDQSFL